jgi:carbonic anhydrase
MEKLFHFDTPAEVYKADACVVSCYDARFELVLRKFLKRRGLSLVDHLKIAGSVKGLASPEHEADREFMLRMIRISMRLHQPELVVMVGHNECGAYGSAPPETIAQDLRLAAQIVRAAEPSMKVECYFADFDGMYRVIETGQTAAAANYNAG